ncbi:MAG: DNA topoisomerase I, partial [Nanoarchaeota archaeon]
EKRKDSTLIITEKPQAALKIASALGNARKYSEEGAPFYELTKDGKKLIVACAVGHLFNLKQKEGQVGWPVFSTEWIPSFNKKNLSYTKKYYNLIKKLAQRANEVIIATDYDIEGEVIGWNVLRFIIKGENAKRMKFSTLTKNELEKSYNNAMPTLDWGQAYAGQTRHQIDWLYGINLSRALMSAIKKQGAFRILSIGRVQGPALKIIVDKEREIANFKPEPYWQIFAIVNDFLYKHTKDVFDKALLAEFENIKEAQAETAKKEEILDPPYPFDLTTLQREAYAWHRLSPSKVLQIAQNLYLDGLISYPRTSSQKIPKEIEPDKILQELRRNFPSDVKYATRKEPIEGMKTDPAHPSIYPTGEYKTLEGDEKNLYELIVKRFISAFSPSAKLAKTHVILQTNDKKFTATGTKILDKGWLNVYPAVIEEKQVPELNGKVTIEKMQFDEKITEPPRRYTPTSLITTLEKKNLGTKTTRSLIIDTLYNRGYLEGASIKATPLGLKLIESLEKHSPIILDENLTAKMENEMEKILESKNNFKEKEKLVLEEAQQIISTIARDFKLNESDIGSSLLAATEELRKQQIENSIIMPCPVCNEGKLVIKFSKKNRRYFVACNRYPQCTTTYSLPPDALIRKTDKTADNGMPILVAIRKGRKPWEFPFNPNYKKENAAQNKKIDNI